VHAPPEQLPLPVIRPSAEASGIDKLKIANAIVANAAIINFIDSPSLNAPMPDTILKLGHFEI
jgi:hypothetical protein